MRCLEGECNNWRVSLYGHGDRYVVYGWLVLGVQTFLAQDHRTSKDQDSIAKPHIPV
jgi:hypothetical protein